MYVSESENKQEKKEVASIKNGKQSKPSILLILLLTGGNSTYNIASFVKAFTFTVKGFVNAQCLLMKRFTFAVCSK